MDLSHEETQLYQVNSVFQINPGKISEPLKKRNPVYKSESNIERKPAIKNEAGSVSSQTNHSEPS